MNNQTFLIKVKQRLNKLGSFDYDNLEDWQILEAANKTQLAVARREARKGEDSKQGAEDISILLKDLPLNGISHKDYFESVTIPEDYLSYKRISVKGTVPECADARQFKVYLGEEANKDDLYRDPERCPSFEWAETFATFISNKIRIHTSNKFSVKDPVLTYYRKPKPISIIGVVDPATGQVITVEQICEFKEDVVELIVDETAMLLAGDIESFPQVQRLAQNTQLGN